MLSQISAISQIICEITIYVIIMIVPATNIPILSKITGSPIQILVVEADPVMQAGLITCLQRCADYLQVAAEAETRSSALLVLKQRMGTNVTIDLVLLGLPVN